MEEEAEFIRTCFGEDSSDAIFRYNNKNYGVRFTATTRRTSEPVNFNYIERLTQTIKDFEKSGRRSMNFHFPASLESIKEDDGAVVATLIMPGTINQAFKIRLDLSKQDIRGKLGLEINCIIKHAG